jgi:hypothetical protein
MSTFNKILNTKQEKQTKNQNKNIKTNNNENNQKQQPSAPLIDITRKNQIKYQIIKENTSDLANYIEHGSAKAHNENDIWEGSYDTFIHETRKETEKLNTTTYKEMIKK